MANDTPPDPAAQFREMLTQWERGVDDFMNRVMGTEDFSRTMNQMQRAQLGAQKAFSDFMSQQWTSMNIPTREDIVQLGEMVRTLDARVERIEQLLQRLTHADTTAKRAGPPRTKRPPSATEPPPSTTTQSEGRSN